MNSSASPSNDNSQTVQEAIVSDTKQVTVSVPRRYPPKGTAAALKKTKETTVVADPVEELTAQVAAVNLTELAPVTISDAGPWGHILRQLKYTGHGELMVTADEIKQCGKSWTGKASQFEPRLLSYQTSANDRPDAFKSLGLYILPIKNGTYMLTKHNIYMSLDYACNRDPIVLKKDTSSLILSMGQSETSLIDNLRYSGVFEYETLLGEPISHGPLLNGRHRISMDMRLGTVPISIGGVQYETDSCFESEHKILLIEGKSGAKEIDSFNIRQLYFPYRAIHECVGSRKEILSIFVHQLGDTVHIWKYRFTDVLDMSSIELAGHFTYRFSS